jgi:hypothetical protein
VDYCRQLLTGKIDVAIWEALEDANFTETVDALSTKARFDMARNLLPELAEYANYKKKSLLGEITHLYFRLANSLSDFEDIVITDFEGLVEDASFCLFSYILTNASFSVALFVENNRVRNYIEGDEAEWLTLFHWDKKRNEIIAYLRDTITGSEYMSDEMVLKVAGIKL